MDLALKTAIGTATCFLVLKHNNELQIAHQDFQQISSNQHSLKSGFPQSQCLQTSHNKNTGISLIGVNAKTSAQHNSLFGFDYSMQSPTDSCLIKMLQLYVPWTKMVTLKYSAKSFLNLYYILEELHNLPIEECLRNTASNPYPMKNEINETRWPQESTSSMLLNLQLHSPDNLTTKERTFCLLEPRSYRKFLINLPLLGAG